MKYLKCVVIEFTDETGITETNLWFPYEAGTNDPTTCLVITRRGTTTGNYKEFYEMARSGENARFLSALPAWAAWEDMEFIPYKRVPTPKLALKTRLKKLRKMWGE